MFEDTLELAENKLLLLYIFNKIKFPISSIQITQIVLENNFINYFTLHQYISELVSSSLLKYTEEEKHRLIVSDKGIKVLSMFENRLSKSKIQVIENYLDLQIENIKKEVTVTADYTIENNDNYIVNLKASENNIILIDLKINVASNKQARELCTKWKNDSSNLYNKIINTLIGD